MPKYSSTGMNVRIVMACQDKAHKAAWQVIQRHCNYSAFNGYHYTPSDYSRVHCPVCGRSWRTKAAYVDGLPDAPIDWWKTPDRDTREAAQRIEDTMLYGLHDCTTPLTCLTRQSDGIRYSYLWCPSCEVEV